MNKAGVLLGYGRDGSSYHWPQRDRPPKRRKMLSCLCSVPDGGSGPLFLAARSVSRDRLYSRLGIRPTSIKYSAAAECKRAAAIKMALRQDLFLRVVF
jgi:hypothetical protein